MRSPLRLSVTLAALVVAACDAGAPTSPDFRTAPEPAAPAISAVPGVQEVVGPTGPGSTYALFRPAAWNGELVVYAHGYVQPFFEPALPTEFGPVRDALLMQGFAVAYSSYAETGYAVKDGAQRTHQLSGLFAEAFGAPARTYLVGSSLGGMIVEMLSERFPSQYDGTLALCGAVAGGQYNAGYVADFRVLFDAFFPGVLKGSLYESPPGYIVAPGSGAYNAIVGAILGDFGRAAEMAAVDQIDLAWTTPEELITSFLLVLGYQINGANALTGRLHGHGFFDNTATRYTGSRDDDALNATVARFAADPAAANYMRHWWAPAGRIERPFVTLHTTRDPLVPLRNEDVLAERVAEAGSSGWLLQLEKPEFGHCSFGPADVGTAFGALVQWVRSGVRPAL